MRKLFSAKFTFGFIALFFLFARVASAQSDYEKTVKFKSGVQKIEESIKNASNLNDCSALEEQIAKLKSDNIGDKDLLDKSLYPDNFSSSIEKLEKALQLRKGDFTQITQLNSEVGALKDQVSDLNAKNFSLIIQIQNLNRVVSKDKKMIDSLNTLVSTLRASIRERDKLVMGMVDSLLTQFDVAPDVMTDGQQSKIVASTKSKNLFFNVERTINDNIQLMEATQLKADDISEMKKQQIKLNKLWRQIGPKIADVFLKKKERTTQIEQINSDFARWNALIDNQLWKNVDLVFRSKGVRILPFDSGQEFSNNVKGYIQDELKNLPTIGKDQSLKEFKVLSDSIWFGNLKKEWIPVLRDNELLSEAQKDTIENNLALWKSKVSPPFAFTWIFVALGGIIIVIIILFAILSKSKKKKIE